MRNGSPTEIPIKREWNKDRELILTKTINGIVEDEKLECDDNERVRNPSPSDGTP